mmetsp:Transcript_10267/g.29323  ORF Transcript_10267/g.29323 Transcript_10267/m.29323 type:complete len:201 (-) Transcript_10267:226-828(-)
MDFPRYNVSQGKDFLMLSGFAPQNLLFSDRTPAKRLFQNVTSNFIYVSRLNGKFLRLRYVQRTTRCVMAAPYASQNEVAQCTGKDRDGLECPDMVHEEIFREFMHRRNYNTFLMGQADNRIAYGSRRVAITQASKHLPAKLHGGLVVKRSPEPARVQWGPGLLEWLLCPEWKDPAAPLPHLSSKAVAHDIRRRPQLGQVL